MADNTPDKISSDLSVKHSDDSERIGELLREAVQTLRGAKKLGTEKRVKLIGQLVKAHSELVKTQRTISGLDQMSGDINAGIIIIPEKSKNWIQDAQNEIENAKKLIQGSSPGEAQVNNDSHQNTGE